MSGRRPSKTARPARLSISSRATRIFGGIFPADIDNAQVAALAAVLAEAMMIPDDERAVLLSHRRTAIEPDDSREGAMD